MPNLHSTAAMEGQSIPPTQWKNQPGVTAYQIQDWDESHRALAGVIARIRQSLDLETIFNTTVTEVRQLLQTDRVGVLRFDRQQGWQGELIWEDVGDRWVRGLELKVQDQCFGDRFAPLYRQGRISAIRDIYQDGLKDCHVQMLEKFQVRANLVAPLLKEEQLWGLLCIHQCSKPRMWKLPEIEFASQIAQHLGVALQQNELLEQARDRARKQTALNEVVAKIRQSLDLETIFANTVTQMRQLLQADRVGIWYFHPQLNGGGEFICEDVGPYWRSIIEEKITDRSLQSKWTVGDRDDRIRVIPDIYKEDLDPNYRQILEQFQVRANLTVPLWKGNSLWGLLCVHQCLNPRNWEPSEIEFVRQIAEHLAIALQQADYLEQVQKQSAQLAQVKEREKAAQCQKTLLATVDKIRQSLDIDTIFNTTTQEVRRLIAAERVTIFRLNSDLNGDRRGEFVAESWDEVWPPVVGTQWQIPDGWWEGTRQTLAVDRISTTEPDVDPIALPESFQAKAYMMAPIFQGDRLWGLLGAYQNSAPRHWQGHEVDLLAQIGTQLGIASQQAEYMKQVQAQSAQLTIVSEHEKAAGRHKTLVKTIDRIRQSLDIDTIFSTTTEEVRELLAVEGVAIYCADTPDKGEIVARSADQSDLACISDQLSIADRFCPANPESTYAGDRVYVVNDLSQVEHSNSQVNVLEQVGAQAYIIVPILTGEELWGWLAVYQNSHPRDWEEYEVDLLIQVGSQLGVALQQGELLKQTRQQATELSRMLQELQSTQSHLIQSEKMVALGQLVAGIAHEINNPVNFIYANISHANEYARDLLKLLNLYEECYPEPDEKVKELSEEIDLDFLREDLAKTLDSMKVGADRIRQIVLSLRTFSRLDESKMKPVNIHDGIDSTLVILLHRLHDDSDREIEVVKNYGNLPKVECYAAEINQVFMNILNNAIDAVSESSIDNPTITISTAVEQQQAVIKIADNGSGIPESVRSRIFDPFFTTKEVGQGTGLGLSISYQIIVDKHKGQLNCVSLPDRGTEFVISIPLRKSKT